LGKEGRERELRDQTKFRDKLMPLASALVAILVHVVVPSPVVVVVVVVCLLLLCRIKAYRAGRWLRVQ